MDKVTDSVRVLARAEEQRLPRGSHRQGTAAVDDVAFADRCLHVHEQSCTIDGLWELPTLAGLRFPRWHEPADWLPTELFEGPALSPLVSALEPVQQCQLVERLYRPHPKA